MFELEFMYYQITDNVDEKNRILIKYTNQQINSKIKIQDKSSRFK